MRVTVLTLVLVAVACSSEPPLPDGVTCAKTAKATDSATLTQGLARSGDGGCVVLSAGLYQGSFAVPDGVSVVGETAAVTVSGVDASPVFVLGARSGLHRLSVQAAAAAQSIGVRARSAAKIAGVTVGGAKSAGVLLVCDQDCAANTLRDVVLRQNGIGLWAYGAHVEVTGGTVAEQKATSLASGYGVVANGGASLSMSGTIVADNEDLGVLVDGEGGTQATLRQVSVHDNLGRGIWAQQLAGSLAAPKLTVDGCTIERNRLVGLGVRASTGLAIRGGRIGGTVSVRATSDLDGQLHAMGDGLALFEGSAGVTADQVELGGNERAQILVDKGGPDIALTTGAITQAGEQLGVVIQRTTEPVSAAPTAYRVPAGQELPVSTKSVSTFAPGQ